MNKILVGNNKITCDDNSILINENAITFNNDGEYILEYIQSGEYKINFNINRNIKLIEISFDNDINVNNKYTIDNGSLTVIKFYNNKSVLENINIDLCRPESRVDYYFANICKMEERYTININHKCEKTFSNIVNRSVAFKNSILKFVINSNVVKDAIKSVLPWSVKYIKTLSSSVDFNTFTVSAETLLSSPVITPRKFSGFTSSPL